MPIEASLQPWVRPNTRLLQAREAVALSQEELAFRAGVSRATIGLIERLGYKPGIELQRRIAATLQLTVMDIWPEVPRSGEIG